MVILGCERSGRRRNGHLKSLNRGNENKWDFESVKSSVTLSVAVAVGGRGAGPWTLCLVICHVCGTFAGPSAFRMRQSRLRRGFVAFDAFRLQ